MMPPLRMLRMLSLQLLFIPYMLWWLLASVFVDFEVSSVLLDLALRPGKRALLLWADCVDWFLRSLLLIANFCVSISHSAFTALLSPLRCVVPAQALQTWEHLKAHLLSEIGSFGPAAALQQLPGFAFLNTRCTGQGSETMTKVSAMVAAGPMGRTLSKLGISSKSDSNKQHDKMEDYTASAASAFCHSLFQYLADDEGLEAVKKLFEQISLLLQEFAVSKESQRVSSTGGYMAVLGAYDGVERKINNLTSKLPASVKTAAFPVLAGYGALLASGLLLSLLRFAFYGLH
ncbi:hypothetical protein AXG93_2227s1050 [Marchantia polymorpha subsp. ruderalis]|uniref:Uncharacterized protein n=1 Tax=Marchantia polymorpha subsp. ruderalis TaxID=1480154 RepID=A0A176W105_MARPO|nr:hypothetical protein AXG93_2227s1050 [Marchantia polymorpha subsp. ruderalis]